MEFIELGDKYLSINTEPRYEIVKSEDGWIILAVDFKGNTREVTPTPFVNLKHAKDYCEHDYNIL